MDDYGLRPMGPLDLGPGALPQATVTDGLRPKEPNSKSSFGGYLRSVKSTAVTNAGAESAAVGQPARRRECSLPAGGVATSADLAACCRLRPETVRVKGKCAAKELSQLASADATDRSKLNGQMRAVIHTAAGNKSASKRKSLWPKASRHRSLGQRRQRPRCKVYQRVFGRRPYSSVAVQPG